MESWKEKKGKKQIGYSYTIFVINGMLALSIGSLLPFVRDAKGLEYAFCGLLVSLHSIGNLISSFLAGALAAKIGRKKSVLLFNAFFALAYLLILTGEHNALLALAFFMSGLARGATSNFCNLVVNNLAPGQTWIISGLHAMFSIGAFLFPIILTVLTARNAGNWIVACGFMLVMGILSWLLYLWMPLEEKPQEEKNDRGTWGFFQEPLFYLCTATLFFYLCVEQGVIGWMVTYFKDAGLLNAALSQITASVLWVMILAGRLTTAYLSTKMKKDRLLHIMGTGLVAFFLLLITARSTGLIVIGIMGFGYSMAGIYPTTVSFSGKLIQKYPMAWSFILTLAALGSIIMPSVIGKIAEVKGIVYGMSSIVAAVLIEMILIVLLTGYRKRKGME